MTTITEKFNKIINPTSDTFDDLVKLGSHIATSSQGIFGSASNVSNITQSTTNLNDTMYTLNDNTELVNCIQPIVSTRPIILSIKTKGPGTSTKVNTAQTVLVNIEFGGIAFDAKVEVKLNAASQGTTAPNSIDLAKSKFFISKVTIDPNTVKFDGTKFFTANPGKNIDFNEGTENLKEMTLAQLKTLFANNKIQVSTQVDVTNNHKIFSVLTVVEKTNMNNNNTKDPADTPTNKTDDKTKWTDIAIIATSIASIFGVLLLAKMSFSPSNSEYHDNIKFDDYKDDLDSITI